MEDGRLRILRDTDSERPTKETERERGERERERRERERERERRERERERREREPPMGNTEHILYSHELSTRGAGKYTLCKYIHFTPQIHTHSV